MVCFSTFSTRFITFIVFKRKFNPSKYRIWTAYALLKINFIVTTFQNHIKSLRIFHFQIKPNTFQKEFIFWIRVKLLVFLINSKKRKENNQENVFETAKLSFFTTNTEINFPPEESFIRWTFNLFRSFFFQFAWKKFPLENIFNLANVKVDPETLISPEISFFFSCEKWKQLSLLSVKRKKRDEVKNENLFRFAYCQLDCAWLMKICIGRGR